MKLYIYSKKSVFNNEQLRSFENKYDEVIFITENDYSQLLSDDSEKIIALDPDIINWEFSNELIDKIKNIKAICLQTTGYEWIDFAYCKEKGILVTNVPHYSSNAVAEKSLFMALALAKKFPLFQREGKMNWDSNFIGDDMLGKNASIIGLGDIGLCLAKKLEGIVGKENISYVGNNRKNVDYSYETFDSAISKSEYMFVTCSKNKDSIALFDDLSKFNKNMKVIILVSGFKEISERLVEKCEKGELAGVAFESDNVNRDLKSNIFVTPYNAYYTKESLVKMFDIWTDTILSIKSDKSINVVNK